MSALKRLLRGRRRCAADEMADQIKSDGVNAVAALKGQRLEVERLVAALAKKEEQDV